jgi:F-type H+-transporting ATPase subunit a
MHELGKLHQLIIPVFGHKMVFNLETIVMTWIVMAFLLLLGLLCTRK